MGMPTSEALSVAGNGEPGTRTALLLESIALRHQIAVLQRSRTCLWRIASQAAPGSEKGRGSVGASDMCRGVRSEVKVHRSSGPA